MPNNEDKNPEHQDHLSPGHNYFLQLMLGFFSHSEKVENKLLISLNHPWEKFDSKFDLRTESVVLFI